MNWQELTRITGGKKLRIERIRLEDSGIAIEGDFELPPLAGLPFDDQVFVIAFLKTGGTIKETEQLYGVSYPTIKNRLKRIADQLEFLPQASRPSQQEVLDLLEKGKISVSEALEMLKC